MAAPYSPTEANLPPVQTDKAATPEALAALSKGPAITTSSVASSSSEHSRSSSSLDYNKPADEKSPVFEGKYNSPQTRVKLLYRGALQWLVTCVIAASIIAILYHYSRLDSMSSSETRIFNALVLGFSVILAINTSSAVRSCASSARRSRFQSLTSSPLLFILFILFSLAALVLVACTGFTITFDTSGIKTTLVPGPVSVANLSIIGETSDAASQRVAAHNYGIQSMGFPFQTTRNPQSLSKSSVPGSPPELYLHADEVNTYSLYRLNDLNPIDHITSVPSSRSVRSWTICTNPSSVNITDAYEDGRRIPGSIVTYAPNWLNGVSSFYVRDISDSNDTMLTTFISDSEPYCGPRCAHVYILLYANTPYPSLMDCNNTIGIWDDVESTKAEYTLPDDQARWFAGAIGWSSALATLPADNYYSRFQSSMYLNSPWSLAPYTVCNGPDSAAVRIERFTIGAIAAMDQYNPRVIVEDAMQPQRAVVLHVKWNWAIAILSTIVMLQLGALLTTVMKLKDRKGAVTGDKKAAEVGR